MKAIVERLRFYIIFRCVKKKARHEMFIEEGTRTERPFQAIAAMSLNKVIGKGNKIPWHIPEDFKWFKDKTLGRIVVMGRKTFEGMGYPLPNRHHLVLTRRPQRLIEKHPGVFGRFREWHGGDKFREWRGGKKAGRRLERDFQFDFLRRLFKKAEEQLNFQSRLFVSKRNACGECNLLLLSSINILADFSLQSGRCVFVCGGEEVYRQLLPLCSNLYLTRVKREAEGDSFFPLFEDQFDLIEVVREREAFRIEHWRHKG